MMMSPPSLDLSELSLGSTMSTDFPDPDDESSHAKEQGDGGDEDGGEDTMEQEGKGEGKKISTAAKLKWAVGPTLGIARRTLGR